MLILKRKQFGLFSSLFNKPEQKPKPISKLKPIKTTPNPKNINDPFLLEIGDVFSITGRGTAVTGKVLSGIIYANDLIHIKELNKDVKVSQLVMFRTIVDFAEKGDNVGLFIPVDKNVVKRGMTITKTQENIDIHEPETTKELLTKYPKLNDLRDFINGYIALRDLEYKLDDYGLIKDWQGLECDICDKDDQDIMEATDFIREQLDSDDWISVLGYGDVGYKISENCFYELDVYATFKKVKRKITIQEYKKNIIKSIEDIINNDIDLDLTGGEIKKYTKEILIPLKRILHV